MSFGAAQAQGFLGKIKDAVKNVVPQTEQPAQQPRQLPGITPEAIIGQCPPMPSVAAIVGSNDPRNQAAQDAVKEFHDRINALEERASEALERVNEDMRNEATAFADRTARQTTGRSASELENMSDANLQAMAGDLVAQRMAGAGMGNMSLGDLQALEGKSDEEVMQAMGVGTKGGLTAAELKALEGMNEAEAEAYMRQGDRIQRAKAGAGNPKSMTKAQADKYLAQGQPDPELKQIIDRWAEIDRVNQKEAAETTEKIQEIIARYEPQIAAVPRGVANAHSDALTEEQQQTLKSLADARDTECLTLKRNLISTMQGRIKTKMADVPRYDALRPQSAVAMPSHGYNIAAEYLDVTRSITR
jgi:hypothetical protein